MSWESTALYYRMINEEVKRELGGLHSAEMIIYSVDFEEIERYQANNEWEKATNVLADAAKSLEKAGADFFILATNTMHKVIDEVAAAVSIPTIHIADATAHVIKQSGFTRVALLGTKYTMEEQFYKGKLEQQGIQVSVPNEKDRMLINDVIFNELVLGDLRAPSKSGFLDIIGNLTHQGAEGVILGCTEIGMLVKSDDVVVPVYDTTQIHAKAAVKYALNKES